MSTETSDAPKQSVKSLADRFSREIPPSTLSNVKLRTNKTESPKIPEKPFVPKPPEDAPTSEDKKTISNGSRDDELMRAHGGDAQPANTMESRIKAFGVGLPIPRGNIELKNTKDSSARRSINFVPSATKSTESTSSTKTTTTAPSNVPSTASATDSRSQSIYYKADFPYTAKYPDELTFQRGEVIKLVTYDVDEDGYWKGTLDGKEGLFPNNFVSQYTPTEAELAKLDPLAASKAIAPSKTISSPSTQLPPKPMKPTAPKPVSPNDNDRSKSSSPAHNRANSPSTIKTDGSDVSSGLLTQPVRAAAPKKRPPSALFLSQSKKASDPDLEKFMGSPSATSAQALKKDIVEEPFAKVNVPSTRAVPLQPAKEPISKPVHASRTNDSSVSNSSLKEEFEQYKKITDAKIHSLEEQVIKLKDRLDQMEKL